MSRVQVIKQDDKPAFYVVPADIWLLVREMVEDAEDAAAIREAIANDDGVRYPMAVAFAMADGVQAVRAWREHRQLTQDQLAEKSGLSKPFISQIETGVRVGTVDTLKSLAAALDVPLGALTD